MVSRFFLTLGIAGSVLLSQSASAALHFRKIFIPLEVSAKHEVEATILVPEKLPPGTRVPAVLVFGGFENAGQVLTLLHPDTPVVLASFDYPFSAPRRFRFPQSLLAAPQAKLLFPRTVRGIHELAVSVRKLPQVNPSKLLLIGASFGAPFAVAAAEEDPQIRYLAILDGFGDVPRTAEHVIDRSWSPKFGIWARPLAFLASRLGWLYLDWRTPESYARGIHSGQHVLMITAKRDSIIPRECSDSLWSALAASKARHERIFTAGDHLMPGADALIHQLMILVERWFFAGG